MPRMALLALAIATLTQCGCVSLFYGVESTFSCSSTILDITDISVPNLLLDFIIKKWRNGSDKVDLTATERTKLYITF